jgi:protein gp37
MGTNTKIEWTDATWNPIRARNRETGKVGWFCTHVSEGCRNCYAEKMNQWRGNGVRFAADQLAQVELFLDKKVLDQPLHWKKPRKIFVCDMTDLFHPAVSIEWLKEIWRVMYTADRHTYQILTKRPELMKVWTKAWSPSPLLNVVLMTSVEDQKTADERIPELLATPAAVRGISYEPALGRVDFARWLEPPKYPDARPEMRERCAEAWRKLHPSKLDWIVCGGESGPGARPMHPDWARSARDQCVAAGVPFFFKQFGEYQPVCALYEDAKRDEKENGRGELDSVSLSGEIVEDRQPPAGTWLMERVGKKAAGRLLDGREWNEFPCSAGLQVSTAQDAGLKPSATKATEGRKGGT